MYPEVEGDVHDRVARAWDFSTGFPFPKFEPTCPVCDSDDVGLRYWRWFPKRQRGGTPYRCDVGAKCLVCSVTFTFGVPVRERLYRRWVREDARRKRVWHWREVRDEVGEPAV